MSWKGTSRFNVEGGGVCFSEGGASFLSEVSGCPMGGIGFDGGKGFRKKLLDGGGAPVLHSGKP